MTLATMTTSRPLADIATEAMRLLQAADPTLLIAVTDLIVDTRDGRRYALAGEMAWELIHGEGEHEIHGWPCIYRPAYLDDGRVPVIMSEDPRRRSGALHLIQSSRARAAGEDPVTVVVHSYEWRDDLDIAEIPAVRS